MNRTEYKDKITVKRCKKDYVTLYLFESGDQRVILFLVALDKMQFPTHTTLSAMLHRINFILWYDRLLYHRVLSCIFFLCYIIICCVMWWNITWIDMTWHDILYHVISHHITSYLIQHQIKLNLTNISRMHIYWWKYR